jgi:purine-binding chemotaxis protein CheW
MKDNMNTNEAPHSVNQFLSFFLAGDEYAVNIVQVREIIECPALTRVPGMPRWIRGALNLRGAVVPVVDLALEFGLAETAITRRTCVIIVELVTTAESSLIGVMADAVHQVMELTAADIRPAPAFGPRVRSECIEGMADSNGKFVVLLNIDQVLAESDLFTAPETAHPEDALEAITVA